LKKGFILISLTVLIIVSMVYIKALNTEREVVVRTVSPQIKDINDFINVDGKIKEGNKCNLYIDGINRIKKINVAPGMAVKEGDVLLEIKSVSADDLNIEHLLPDDSGIEMIFKEYGVDIELLNSDNVKNVHSSQKVFIESPITGIITDVNVQVGDVVTPINKLLSVSDLTDIYVEALIPEQYSSKVSESAAVQISANSLGGEVYKGEIQTISPVATYIPSITGEGKTFIASTIKIKNINNKMRPGLNVTTKIQVDEIEDALTIPYECILQDELNREYVYNLKKDGQVQKKYIKTGYELDECVEIRSGISAKDRIVLNPNDEISEAIKVIEMENK